MSAQPDSLPVVSALRQRPAPTTGIEPLYSITEAAKILSVSRATMYNLLRGESIVELGADGKNGLKRIPESTLRCIVDRRRKILRRGKRKPSEAKEVSER